MKLLSLRTRTKQTDAEMKNDSGILRGSMRAVSGVLFLILLMLCLKLTLSLGQFFRASRPHLPDFPSEAIAEDRKAKKEQPADQAKNPAPPASAAEPGKSPPVSDMVTYLEQRESEIKRKEEQLRQKEEYLAQMEKEVEKKLKELTTIQKEIQAYRAEKEEAQSNKIRSLSKIYGSMKAKEAAKLLENLEEQLVVNVISTMTADEAANIMANMDVKKAAKISEYLSHR